jgi:hypothetical protein
MPGYTLARYQDTEQFQPLACVNQTISGAAALAAIPDEARGAIIGGDGSTNAIRYRLDGGVPTATLGIRQEGVDTVTIWSRAALLGMQLIKEDATDVVISVQFFK